MALSNEQLVVISNGALFFWCEDSLVFFLLHHTIKIQEQTLQNLLRKIRFEYFKIADF
jgi:hypothetical protein